MKNAFLIESCHIKKVNELDDFFQSIEAAIEDAATKIAEARMSSKSVDIYQASLQAVIDTHLDYSRKIRLACRNGKIQKEQALLIIDNLNKMISEQMSSLQSLHEYFANEPKNSQTVRH